MLSLALALSACGGAQNEARAPSSADPTPTPAGAGSQGVRVPFAPQITLGTDFGCWLKSNHQVSCWGDLEGKAPKGELLQISAASFHVCGIKKDQSVVCWGAHDQAPAGAFAQISTGDEASCGVRPDGQLVCWDAKGRTQYSQDLIDKCSGEVGDCEGASVLGMRLVSRRPSGTFKRVAVGGRHACALTPDGSAKCWAPAESDEDESAGGEIDDVALPAGKYSEVTAGFMHTCGILEGSGAAGTVVCAGGVEGQSKPGANTAKSIAAGVILSCSLGLDGQAACWGGDGATPPSGKKFVALAVGLRLACGLPAGGDPVCWGETDSSAAP